MIIGLIGPVSQDTAEVSRMISQKSIQVVDSIAALRMADRKTVNSLTIQSYHKKFFLKKLEKILGTVAVSGNLVVSEDIVEWILNEGGIVAVVARDSINSYPKDIRQTMERYWDDKVTQKYNLEVRFKKFHERLSAKHQDEGNIFWIDLSDENAYQLNELLDLCEECDKSSRVGITPEEVLKMTEVRKDDNTMTMEESIKAAMRELGMDVDGDETVQETKPEPKKAAKQPKPAKMSEKKPDKDFINQPEEPVKEDKIGQQENTNDDEDVDAIFVKISDGHMAVLLPEGLQMEKQTIGGVVFNVATVGLPDLNSDKLQELDIIQQQKEVKRVPIIAQKPIEEIPMKTVVVSGDKAALQAEKSRLDAEIKKYRQLGDIDTVNNLRKQRRAVRNKINKL